MEVTTYEAFVENGRIRLPDQVYLPEHSRVYVVVPVGAEATAYVASPHLAHPEGATDFVMEVTEEPPDASV